MTVAGRSRESLRVSVGYALGVLFVGAATSNGTTTTLVDTGLRGGNNIHNGKWVRFTSGSAEGVTVQADDYVESTNTLTLQEAVAANGTDSGVTYELWDRSFNPDRIDDFLLQAQLEVYGRFFDPEVDESLHFDGQQSRFDIPSDFAMLKEVQYRSSIDSISIHNFERLFDETTESQLIQVVDTEDKRQGSSSLKVTTDTLITNGDFITDSITSIDLNRCTHIEGWIKMEASLVTAGDIVLRLDTGVVQGDATDAEILNIAPLPSGSNIWTFFRMPLLAPWDDAAIVSIGLEWNANVVNARSWWFDDIKAVDIDSARWRTIPRHMWNIDRETQDLILTTEGVQRAGYAPMKLIGGGAPLLFSSDTSVTEIPDDFIIAHAVGLAAQMSPSSTEVSARYWLAKSFQRLQAMPPLQNVRLN